MNKPWWTFGFVALTLMAVLIVANLHSSEPVYEGKPESFWVDQLPATLLYPSSGRGVNVLRVDPDAWDGRKGVLQTQQMAERILEAAGTNGWPLLINRLDTHATPMERIAWWLSHRNPSVYTKIFRHPLLHFDLAEVRRGQALTVILDCRFDTARIVPALSKIVNGGNANAARYATWLLQRIDPETAAKAGVK